VRQTDFVKGHALGKSALGVTSCGYEGVSDRYMGGTRRKETLPKGKNVPIGKRAQGRRWRFRQTFQKPMQREKNR